MMDWKRNRTAPIATMPRDDGPAEKVKTAETELRRLEAQRARLTEELATAEADGAIARVEELNTAVERAERQIAGAQRLLSTAQNALAIVRERELEAARVEHARKVAAHQAEGDVIAARMEELARGLRTALGEHFARWSAGLVLRQEAKRLGLPRTWVDHPRLFELAKAADKELSIIDGKRQKVATPPPEPRRFVFPAVPAESANVRAVRSWERP